MKNIYKKISFFSDRILSLENKIKRLKNDYNNVLIERDNCHETINELENQLVGNEKVKSETSDTNDDLELQSNHLEFKVLETMLEQLKAELKAQKHEKEDVDKINETLNTSLRTVKKELKDNNHDFEKKISDLEDKIKTLNEFKVLKAAEEREIKNRSKKLDKKAKQLDNQEAAIVVEKNRLEKEKPCREYVCTHCDFKWKTPDALKTHIQTFHEKCSSTQAEKLVAEDKFVQFDTLDISCNKEVQTFEETSRSISDKNKFTKYQCYYCNVNIAGENHLSDHRKKCHGTTKSGIVGLPPFGFFPGLAPGFLPGFPPPYPNPFPFNRLTGFKY